MPNFIIFKKSLLNLYRNIPTVMLPYSIFLLKGKKKEEIGVITGGIRRETNLNRNLGSECAVVWHL